MKTLNKQQKEILQAQLDSEKKTINELKQVYNQALKDVNEKISLLSARADMNPPELQSIIYQKQYQQAIKGQLEGVMANLQSNEYATISDYLTRCYQDGYIGTMYDLQGQGIPLVIPIDQEQVAKAIQIDSKLSKPLYNRLSEDVSKLKTSVRAEISRGIANGSSWVEVGEKISKSMKNTPFEKSINNSIRIARTEGHRIQNAATLDAQHKAKEKGANIIKQWDSTLDGATRDTHRQLDGQIREIDEDFEVNGLRASAPGMFGDPAEDCNCRCALLQRARWALDESELDTLKERAEYFGLDKTDDFNNFKERYLEASETVAKDRLGIFSNNNKSDPMYYDYKDKDIKTVESEIGQLDYEVGVIFDKKGKAISCQLGVENEVAFTKYQCKLMKGNDVTHSHPLSTPPSPEDLYLLVDNEANSFRTCGKNGTYVLEYSKELSDLPEFEVFSNRYDDLVESLQPKYLEEVSNGMAKEEALIKLGEEVWDKLYNIYGIKPTFERR